MNVQAMLIDFAKQLDPTPAQAERIRERVMLKIAGPSKERMLERYRQAYAEMVGLKDNASDEFLFARADRDHARAGAMQSGATQDEIKAIEREIRGEDTPS